MTLQVVGGRVAVGGGDVCGGSGDRARGCVRARGGQGRSKRRRARPKTTVSGCSPAWAAGGAEDGGAECMLPPVCSAPAARSLSKLASCLAVCAQLAVPRCRPPNRLPLIWRCTATPPSAAGGPHTGRRGTVTAVAPTYFWVHKLCAHRLDAHSLPPHSKPRAQHRACGSNQQGGRRPAGSEFSPWLQVYEAGTGYVPFIICLVKEHVLAVARLQRAGGGGQVVRIRVGGGKVELRIGWVGWGKSGPGAGPDVGHVRTGTGVLSAHNRCPAPKACYSG